ncbi:MAG: serine/threonine protein kinase/formylglycine-generating enzyme required for sulfatase activity [Planctomycetota bacterium]|jgi:serine/threonine protein kinase/formylglycine-generating enzyme required for sulfatase activity
MKNPNPNDSLDHDPLDATHLGKALDRGFAAAHEESEDRNPSVLKQIGARIGSRPSVSLRDVDSTGEIPMLEPVSGKSAKLKDTGRYKVLGILGQGGVGAVHRGHDTDLGRDVAMKFLHERYAKEPSVLHRFVEEAQIGGQLQHPGIVPVYELGMADGKPFFTMKMVKGETLAKKLTERADIGADRRKFMVIFEDICQTMAYAHARGVVHRDLKPANIMIGSFGEVQVVDWGMGKVLSSDDGLGEPGEQELQSQASVIETARSSGRGTQSIMGSVMGTPAYMPPEQAQGDVDAMDERSDVFALGAVLCEILTGAPPYVGDQSELLAMASLARIGGAHARLAESGAEQDLIDLATLCLMPSPAARPRSAREVAQKVQKHLAAAEERVHESAIRAISLKRIQQLGIALLAVIAVGLAASIGFGGEAADARVLAEERRGKAENSRASAEASMAAAEESWQAADRLKLKAEASTKETKDYLDKFDMLKYVLRLESAQPDPQWMYPARPENASAMRAWLEGDAKDLLEVRPTLLAEIIGFQAKALPQTEAEAAANAQKHPHPLAAELRVSRSRLKALVAARDVRLGSAQAVPFEPPSQDTGLDELLQGAKRFSGESRDVMGREAEGLALARRAVELSKTPSGIAKLLSVRNDAGIALAWALFANGLEDEARTQRETSLADVTKAENLSSIDNLVRLQLAMEKANSPEAAAEIEQLTSKVADLETAVAKRWHWTLEKEEELFLHDTLRELVAGIGEFEATVVAHVRQQLLWAEQVDGLTKDSYKEKWDAARLAIAAADGEIASKLYAADRFSLYPQRGLVPIGMNPVTKLWEFYHLRSAWDGVTEPSKIEVPKHQADGTIRVNDDTGIVFVLLPGGAFTMGAQKDSPDKPNFDPQAGRYETGHFKPVTVKPFFMARHELTQGQWLRLWSGKKSDRHPTFFRPGQVWNQQLVSLANPVENINWHMGDQLVTRAGLMMPTEEQWEYGCRSQTTTPWSCDQANLKRFANVNDKSVERYKLPFGAGNDWDDGYVGSAPVGSFAANRFGFHDMHGNVQEMTQTRTPPGPMGHSGYILRGGSFKEAAAVGRSSSLRPTGDLFVDFSIGLRPARKLDGER